jgi:hypothetical protein
MKITSILKLLLLEAYSEKTINDTINRWKIANPKIEDGTAETLIKRFDQIKSGLGAKLDVIALPDELKKGNNYLNIDKYSYDDMDRLIKSIPENPEKVKKDAINRFVEKFGIDKPTAQSYTARFMSKRDTLKFAVRDGLEDMGFSREEVLDLIPKKLQQKEAFLDPRNWGWQSFEQILDALFPSQKTVSGSDGNLASTDNDKIYDKNGIEIYKGDDVHKCISYNPVVDKRKKYGWCVTQVGNTNYDYYRFGDKSPTFYFVFDRNKPSTPQYAPFEDQWHAFVIQVTADSKEYIVTGANNRGDISTEDKGWEGVKNIVPSDTWNEIKNLKDYFKPISLSAIERGRKFTSGKNLTLDEFKELTQDEKILYIQGKASKNQVSPEIIEILLKYKINLEGRTTTLANIAIDSGQEIPYSALKNYEALAKRYAIFRFRHTNYGTQPIPLPYIKYLDEPAKEKYLKTFDENLTFEYIEKYFGSEQAKKYVNEQVKTLSYLPPSAIKYIDNSKIKDLYSIYTKLFKNWVFSSETNIDEKALEDQKTMPKQSVSPSPILFDDWKSLSSQERQVILSLAKTSDSDITKYMIASYAVPFFLQDGGQTYAFLPLDDSATEWIIADMQGNQVSEVISTDEDEITLNGGEIYSAYPDYSLDDTKRIYPLSSLKFGNKLVSLKEIKKRMMQLAGIIK